MDAEVISSPMNDQLQQIGALQETQSMCVLPLCESPTDRSQQQPRIVNGRPVGIKPFNVSFDRTKKFPEKLWDALNDQSSDCLRWSTDGKSILVEDKKFTSDIMTRHPGLVQITSFTNFRRQLREYGFDWYINNKCEFEFTHPCFARESPDLLESMQSRRKCQSQGRVHPSTKERGRGRSSRHSNHSRYNFSMKRTQSDTAVNKSTQVPVFFSPFPQPPSSMLPIAMWQQANFANRQLQPNVAGDNANERQAHNIRVVTPANNPVRVDDQPVKSETYDTLRMASQCDLQTPDCLPFNASQSQRQSQHFSCQYPCNIGAAPVWFPGGMYGPNCWYTNNTSQCFGGAGPSSLPSVPYANAVIASQELPIAVADDEQSLPVTATSHAHLTTVPPERFQQQPPLRTPVTVIAADNPRMKSSDGDSLGKTSLCVRVQEVDAAMTPVRIISNIICP